MPSSPLRRLAVASLSLALAASLFHYGELAFGDLKDALAGEGIAVRREPVAV